MIFINLFYSSIKLCYIFYNSPAKSKDDASSTEEDWDADEKEEIDEEKKEPKIKSPKVCYFH